MQESSFDLYCHRLHETEDSAHHNYANDHRTQCDDGICERTSIQYDVCTQFGEAKSNGYTADGYNYQTDCEQRPEN
jgi:hypothetical protein